MVLMDDRKEFLEAITGVLDSLQEFSDIEVGAVLATALMGHLNQVANPAASEPTLNYLAAAIEAHIETLQGRGEPSRCFIDPDPAESIY
jgi:hypothetical protein